MTNFSIEENCRHTNGRKSRAKREFERNQRNNNLFNTTRLILAMDEELFKEVDREVALYEDDEESTEELVDALKDDSKDSPIPSAKKGEPISKDMMIEDVIMVHPDLAPVIMDYGVHCVGCGASGFETIEEGFMGHGMSEEEIDDIIIELNKLIAEGKK